MVKEKRTLFGGALRSAGLAAAAAMSASAMADFSPLANGPGFTPSQAGFYGTGPAGTAYLFGYTYAAAFTPSYSYSAAGFAASVDANSTLIGASMTITDAVGWNYGIAVAIQWFTATSFGKEVTFSWDFTNVTDGLAYVYQVGAGIISTVGIAGTSGSEALSLNNGNTYAFLTNIFIDSETGSGFAKVENVPAPGAFAVFGVGLLGVRKRRRRE